MHSAQRTLNKTAIKKNAADSLTCPRHDRKMKGVHYRLSYLLLNLSFDKFDINFNVNLY